MPAPAPHDQKEDCLQLEFSEAAWDELSLLREALSRLQYAPSKKTIIHGLLAILPDWYLGNPHMIDAVQRYSVRKVRGSLAIAKKECDSVRSDLFSTSLKEVNLSKLLDYLLIHLRGCANNSDFQGALLKRLMRGPYVRQKGVIMFRLPKLLECAIFAEASSARPSSVNVDTWKRRYYDSTKEFQETVQVRIEDLFLRAFEVPRQTWPPLAARIAQCRSDAVELLQEAASSRILTIQLQEDTLSNVRKMDPGNLEIATVATLIWCQVHNLF